MNSGGAAPLVWHIELLGELRAQRLDRPEAAPLQSLGARPAALLAFLARDARPHKRESVAEALWPDADLLAARNRLRVSLSLLRALLEPDAALKNQILIANKDTLALNRVSVDLQVFRARLRESEGVRDEKSRLAIWEAAISPVCGPLLRGFYEDWAVGEAAPFENEFLRVVRQIVVRREAQGDFLAALGAARRGNALAPLQQSLMGDIVRLGMRAGLEEDVKSEFENWRRRLSAQGEDSVPQWKEFSARALRKSAPHASLLTPSVESAQALPQEEFAPFAPPPLPASLTTFVGRRAERQTLSGLLSDESVRLVSILGTGGVGKTRLALEIAREIRNRANSEDFFGVAWASLSHLPSPRLLGGAILDGLGFQSGDESIETVTNIVNEFCERENGRLLLVLDNFEPFRESGAPWVRTLLTRAPRLVMVTTSRSPLNLEGERPIFLEPLGCERRSAARVLETSNGASNSADWPDAARLFVERARVVRPNFSLSSENLDAVVRLCERIGALPLAIEITAARCALFQPAQLLEDLETQQTADFDAANSLFNWPNPLVDAGPRQRNLRVAIEWSVRQLPAQAAQFWAQVSVFHGGFTLAAAEWVCEEKRAPSLVLALRDASLLSLDARPPRPRALWIETLREFAWARLDGEERAHLQARHAAYFLDRAEKYGHIAHRSKESEAECPNLRAAFDWFLTNDATGALRIVAALWWHWEQCGRILEGRAALDAALAADAAPPKNETPETQELADWRANWQLRGRVFEGAGKLANIAADLEVARGHLQRARLAFERAEDEKGVAACLYSLGFNALQRGETPKARVLCEQSVGLARALDDRDLLGDALHNLASVALTSGDFVATRELSIEVLAVQRAAQNARGVALALESLGMCALFEGEIEAARPCFEEALKGFEALDDKASLARALWGLGHVTRAEGDGFGAARHFGRALQLSRSAQNLWAFPYLLEAFALLAGDAQFWPRAARLLAGAAHWREKHGAPLPHAVLSAPLETVANQARAALGTARFSSEWSVGQSLTRDQLCVLALAATD